jgi:hypothetical protein
MSLIHSLPLEINYKILSKLDASYLLDNVSDPDIFQYVRNNVKPIKTKYEHYKLFGALYLTGPIGQKYYKVDFINYGDIDVIRRKTLQICPNL